MIVSHGENFVDNATFGCGGLVMWKFVTYLRDVKLGIEGDSIGGVGGGGGERVSDCYLSATFR
jgi:hypothetical protein